MSAATVCRTQLSDHWADRVNEFDSDAWGSVFDAMTKEREESESAEAVSARQAAEMVTKMLEDMQEKRRRTGQDGRRP